MARRKKINNRARKLKSNYFQRSGKETVYRKGGLQPSLPLEARDKGSLLAYPGYGFVYGTDAKGRTTATLVKDEGQQEIMGNKVDCDGCSGGYCKRKGALGYFVCDGNCDSCDLTISTGGNMAYGVSSNDGSTIALPPQATTSITADGDLNIAPSEMYGYEGITIQCRCTEGVGRCYSASTGGEGGCVFGDGCNQCRKTVKRETK